MNIVINKINVKKHTIIASLNITPKNAIPNATQKNANLNVKQNIVKQNANIPIKQNAK
jgi:hypothetical protein